MKPKTMAQRFVALHKAGREKTRNAFVQRHMTSKKKGYIRFEDGSWANMEYPYDTHPRLKK